MTSRKSVGTTILIVDPDPTARAMLYLLLTNHDYVVSQADSFTTALAAFTQESHALVIAADRLGKQTGLELLQLLHTRQHAPGGIIVGRRSIQHLQMAQRNGADEYIARPVDEANLIIACEHALAIRAARHGHDQLTTRIERLQAAFVIALQTISFTAQGRISTYIAHEINNPLTPILGQAELLNDEFALNDPRRKQVSAIIGSVQRIRTVIQRMLTFARPMTHPYTLIDIVDLVESMLLLTKQRLDDKDITYSLVVPETVLISGNASQLTDALLHLVDNAYDAMPQGGALNIMITIEIPSIDGMIEGPTLTRSAVIDMTDTGNGIATQHQPYIFDLFYSTKTQSSPVGTGLSLARSIIAAHGGTLTFATQEGQGSTFRVHLPLYNTSA